MLWLNGRSLARTRMSAACSSRCLEAGLGHNRPFGCRIQFAQKPTFAAPIQQFQKKDLGWARADARAYKPRGYRQWSTFADR